MSEPILRIAQVANLSTNISNAYAAANTAANTVAVRANSASTQNAVALNFVNTATVTVSVAAGSSGNANISFSTAGASESFHPFLLGV
jgi:hypothetical protein